MTSEDVLDEFRDAGALREGHFVLSSGLHSPLFLQKNLVFMDPARCARLCKALAEKIVAAVGPVDVAISPAVGGIIPGYETARWLGVPSMYVEREGGEFKLRRGFHVEPGQKVVMVEDIVTSGLSSRDCIEAIRKAGGDVVAAACMMPGPPPVAMTLSRGWPTSPRIAPPRSEASLPNLRASSYQYECRPAPSAPTRALPNTTRVERTPQARSALSVFSYSSRKRTPRIWSLSRKSRSMAAMR